jgi:ABC-2 type transport system permease protein
VTIARPSLDDVYLRHTGRSLTRHRGARMSTTLTHSWFMTMRHLRNLGRQPWWIAITLVQPSSGCCCSGPCSRPRPTSPVRADSYIDYLTPGIVVMTAAFAGGWPGMGVIEDLNRGVIDRFLVSPVARQALITGRLVQLAIVSVIQSAIVITSACSPGPTSPAASPAWPSWSSARPCSGRRLAPSPTAWPCWPARRRR